MNDRNEPERRAPIDPAMAPYMGLTIDVERRGVTAPAEQPDPWRLSPDEHSRVYAHLCDGPNDDGKFGTSVPAAYMAIAVHLGIVPDPREHGPGHCVTVASRPVNDAMIREARSLVKVAPKWRAERNQEAPTQATILIERLANALEATLATEEVLRLLRVIERDRTATANWIGRIEAILNSYEWLREGRGVYEYDDDRYREEFRRVGDELRAATAQALQETHATDFADSPATSAEVALARNETAIIARYATGEEVLPGDRIYAGDELRTEDFITVVRRIEGSGAHITTAGWPEQRFPIAYCRFVERDPKSSHATGGADAAATSDKDAKHEESPQAASSVSPSSAASA